MKEFAVDHGPHIKDYNNTSKMMRNLFIALFPIIIFSYIKNGLLPFLDNNISFLDSLKPLLIILIGGLTCILIEVFWAKFIKKEEIKKYMSKSYAAFPGIILGLTLPLNTPYYAIVIGAIFATFFGKLVFGGFGHNIFNPAGVGRLFIILSYYSVIASNGGYLNGSELDAISSATPLTNASSNLIGSYTTLVEPYGTLWDFFLGFIPGSLGETSALLCLIGLIYLLIKKVVPWRIPIIYIGTVFIITFIVGLCNNLGIWYSLFHILSGGLMFGAIFMATDPVTSPTTPSGQVFYALGLGFLTVVFRFLSAYPEGVLTSILTMNFLVVIIDRIFSRGRFDKKKLITPFVILILLIGAVTFYISTMDEKESSEESSDFKVNNVITENDNTIYNVTYKGYHGNIEANITFKNDEVVEIEITKQNENVWQSIIYNDYLNKIISHQDNLEKLDAISGATYTSDYLKEMVDYTIKYHEGDNDE
jgi:electron transport complex protein RnfD